MLHCISSYPAPIEQSNLLTIPHLAKRFGLVTGLSDHTLGTTASVTSVALGSAFIEKHFTLSRQDKGPDCEFSLEPDELTNLCLEAKDAWLSLGLAGYEKKQAELDNVKFRRSLYFVNDLKKGQVITKADVRSIRPGFGLAPKYLDKVIGSRLNKSVSFSDAVSMSDFSEL